MSETEDFGARWLGGRLRELLPGFPDLACCVAFSGGPDSTALLDAAVRVGGAARCMALHIHHGLSPNADAWLAQCEAFARERGVGFAAQHVDVSREPGMSVEATARDAAGNLYGTAPDGGKYGNGVVFALSPTKAGWQYKVIHAFTGKRDGALGSRGNCCMCSARAVN